MVLQGCGSLDLLKEDLVLGIGVPIPVRREVAGLITFSIFPINERRMNLVVCISACEIIMKVDKTYRCAHKG